MNCQQSTHHLTRAPGLKIADEGVVVETRDNPTATPPSFELRVVVADPSWDPTVKFGVDLATTPTVAMQGIIKHIAFPGTVVSGELTYDVQAIDCSGTACDLDSCGKRGYTKCEALNNNCKAVYKRNNPKFSNQGAVSGGSRINRLKYQTQLKAQSVYKPVLSSSTAFNKYTNAYGKINTTGSINATNGVYPVSLYRNTYPIYKSNLGGLCLGNVGLTLNNKPQRCKMSDTPALCRVQTIIQSCNFPCNKPCKK